MSADRIQPIRIEAPAKINLRLVVLGREASGYHSLETLFCAISLSDTVEIEPSDAGIELVVTGAVDTGPVERNLAWRAADAFYRAIGAEPAITIRLKKQIPAAAGLGGGSSDAAATLRALDAAHGNPLSRERLATLGAALGSDVPFFLGRSTFALAWGRGERQLELPAPSERSVLIAHPNVAMPTGETFERLREIREESGTVSPEPWAVDPAAFTDWSSIAAIARNDFDPIASERIPRYPEILETLRTAGASIALLSGSGSAIFGIFPADADLPGVSVPLAQGGLSVYRATTLRSWPEPLPID